MGRVIESQHPLIKHHLSILRNKATPPAQFRDTVKRLTLLLTHDATASLPIHTKEVETPLTTMQGKTLSERIGLVPVLRAGLGMSQAVLELIPDAEVWHLGFYRDESTYEPVEYYQKLSNSPPHHALILDPMLATGGSACAAIESVRKWGVKSISLLCLIAAPEGLEKVTTAHNELDIFTCAIDDHLNEQAYIVPGLGDAGDRIFNTI